MLVIKTIKLTGDTVIKPKKLSKVRVGYDEHVCSNKKPPRLFQNQTIQWKQDMTLPLFFKKTIQFQFCPAHQFGYNPEEISSICYAQAKIQNFRKLFMETDAVDSKGNVVGRVHFEFSVINDHRTKFEIEIETKVIVSSLLAHLNTLQGEKGQMQIVVDDQNVCTPEIKVEAGQLTWVQKEIINLFHELSQQKQILIKVYIQDNPVGEASLTVKEIKTNKQKYKKVFIYDTKNKKIGILFIEIKIKNVKQKNNVKSQISQNRSNVKNGEYFPPLTPIKKYEPQQKMRSSRSERKLTPAAPKQSTQSNFVYSRVKTKPQTNEMLAAKLGQYNRQSSMKFKI